MISTLVLGGMIPSTLPIVDGSERTLIWVDDVPSTGASVGWRGGGSGVSVGARVSGGGNVELRTTIVGVAVAALVCTPQLLRRTVTSMMQDRICFLEVTT
jgi:hypothetical protein